MCLSITIHWSKCIAVNQAKSSIALSLSDTVTWHGRCAVGAFTHTAFENLACCCGSPDSAASWEKCELYLLVACELILLSSIVVFFVFQWLALQLSSWRVQRQNSLLRSGILLVLLLMLIVHYTININKKSVHI